MMLLLLLVKFGYSQVHAQIVNGSFEIWDSTDSEPKNFLPLGWSDVNNLSNEYLGKEWSVTQSTDSRSGKYAIQLKNVQLDEFSFPAAILTQSLNGNSYKIPVSGHHKNFTGYYKYSTPLPDTFFINVVMTIGDSVVGVGSYMQSNQTNIYTVFNVPIDYTNAQIVPDSAMIAITAGSTSSFVDGTTLILDDLMFKNASTGLTRPHDYDISLDVYPNPAKDNVNLLFKDVDEQVVTIELIDLLGKTIQTQVIQTTAGLFTTLIDIAACEAGTYYIKVTGNQWYKGLRFIKE